jgi:hypothetical protein
VAALAFIAAHLCLAAAFVRDRGFRGRDLLWLIPPAVAVLAFARAELPRVSGAVRSTVLVVYLLALLAMVWRALCSAARSPRGAARVLGASLFFGTDLCTIAEIAGGTRAYAHGSGRCIPPPSSRWPGRAGSEQSHPSHIVPLTHLEPTRELDLGLRAEAAGNPGSSRLAGSGWGRSPARTCCRRRCSPRSSYRDRSRSGRTRTQPRSRRRRPP